MPLDADDFEFAMQLAKWTELELSLPTGFIGDLLGESDWGLVIKLNAIFESLLNASITRTLRACHSNGLEEIVVRLDMADHRRGKIAIAAQLELIGPGDRRFLEALAELRNSLAHSVNNLNFDFSAWVALMDAHQRKTYAKKFTSGGEGMVSDVKFADDPKEFVFYNAISVMHQIDTATPQKWAQDLRREAEIDLSDIQRLTDEADTGDEQLA